MTDVTNQQLLQAISDNNALIVGVAQTVETIVDNMVTKKDLDDRLKAHPTKKDLDDRLKKFATKDDLQQTETRLENKIGEVKTGLESKITDAQTGLEGKINDVKTGLERKLIEVDVGLRHKIDAKGVANVKHHLETRKMIGDLNRRYDALREG